MPGDLPCVASSRRAEKSSTELRLEGWEERLAGVIEAARLRPFELGRHDCFTLACQAIFALTGEDVWSAFAGYRTEGEVKRLMAAQGSNFEACFDAVFGSAHVCTTDARRGDLCAVPAPRGDKALGVCLGADTAFLAREGLTRVPTLDCLCCWMIG